ncbi:MAG: ABC transporter permease [Microscillaceae bacterium]|jgi:putative ABC transport system permease protein|nr:ABC transporter permease [Microscillaceae bacterium]
MFQNYLKTTLRNIWRNKLYSFINLFGLAIGLCGCLLIFLFVKDELSYDKFHKNLDKIYRVNVISKYEGKSHTSSISNLPIGETMQKELPGVETFVRLANDQRLVRVGNRAFMEELHNVDNNFLAVFSFPLRKGNSKTVLKNANSAVITEKMALKYFGSTDVMGKNILIEYDNKFVPYMISGIAEDMPENSSIRFGILLPFTRLIQENEQNDYKWLNFFINTFVVLKPNAKIESLEAQLPQLIKKYAQGEIERSAKEHGGGFEWQYTLQSFKTVHLNGEINNGNGIVEANNPMYSYILFGIASFILIIACINFTNLSLAQSLPRAKEIGVRKVIGATRYQVMFQFLGEAFLLCLLATVAGFALAEVLLPWFNKLSGKNLSFHYLDWQIPVGVMAILVISALLAGFYPALVLSSFQPVKVLKGKQKIGRSNLFTKSLVVIQFALSVFLMIGMVAFYQQLNFLLQKDLGYKTNNLIRLNPGWGRGNQLLPLIRNELNQNPDVELITGRSGGTWMSPFEFDGKRVDVIHQKVDEDFLNTFQIKLKQGRNFSRELTTDSAKSVIVNEALVAKLGIKNPIGVTVQKTWDKSQKYKIIGVIQDYHSQSLHQKIEPMMWHIFAQNDYGEIWVRAKEGKAVAVNDALKKIWRKLEPYRPFDSQFAEIITAQQYEREQRWQKIVSSGALFAIFISLIGLFGLATLNISQRTKEIGIRKILGASLSSIIWLLSSEFNRLVLLGIVLAIPAGYYAVDWWLQNFAYRISLNISLFVVAGLLTLLIAFVAVLYQTFRIARTNPVESLRYE